MKDFYQALIDRRTYYALDRNVNTPDDRIAEIIKQAVKYAPYAFNSQSGRVVVLFGRQHERLWEITRETLRKIVPKESFEPTGKKMDSFAAAYGTVLFYEDQQDVSDLQKSFPLYKDNFPVWSEQASGILQYIVWTSLEIEGLGASLQHYNPLIDDQVRKEWSIPENWKLIGQMPFGNPAGQPGDKEFKPVEDRVKIFK